MKNIKKIIIFLLCSISFIYIIVFLNNTITTEVLAQDQELINIDRLPSVRKMDISYSKSGQALYFLNKEDLLLVAGKKKVSNDGFIRWDGWKALCSEEILSGTIPLNRVKDDVYMSMKLPSEVQTFMQYRVNPEIIKYKPSGYVNAVGIGAVYKVEGAVLPEKFNVYIGKMKTFFC